MDPKKDKKVGDARNEKRYPENKGKSKKRRKSQDPTKSVTEQKKGASNPSREEEVIPTSNDWRFYAVNEQIAKDLGSIPYNVIPGLDHSLDYYDAISGSSASNVQMSNANVLTLEYVLGPGFCNTATDGPNMAAKQLYSFVRRANSGARNYEAPDLFMYILAMQDIYATYFEARRVITLAQAYSAENRVMPQKLIAALGVNYADLSANLSVYRGQLNVLASQINAFAVPGYFKAFERTAYVASNVFVDATTVRGQFYALARAGYRTWSGTASETGTSLVYNDLIVSTLRTFKVKFLDVLTAQLNALFYDDDANTMSGDILKAFGSTKLYGVPSDLSESTVTFPVFDEDVLNQIENCYSLWN